jgi:seryl-tRNA synthetase
MWPHNEVVAALRARGELWHVAPGVTALGGDVAALLRSLDRAIGALCSLETADEWRVPPAIDLSTLARADYFASFPHWLTLASHLRDDEESLLHVAQHADPAWAVRDASAPPGVALNPAVCYHVYAAIAEEVIDSPRLVTAQAECWRHEGMRYSTLERAWSFTMREIVCIGTEGDARDFLEGSIERVGELARSLGLDGSVAVATDPFFAPSGRAKRVLQRIKELKRELLLPIDATRTVAAASFNLHDTFFGEAFNIRLPDGGPATTACVAFGLERWLLAFLVMHGPYAHAWPAIDVTSEVRRG